MSLHTVVRIHHDKAGPLTHTPTISTYPQTPPKCVSSGTESGKQGCPNRDMAASGHKLHTNDKVYLSFP